MNKIQLLQVIAVLLVAQAATPAWAVNEYFPTWYVGLRGGVGAYGASDGGDNPLDDTDFDPGFNAGAVFGIKMPRAMLFPLNGLSAEVEVSRYWHHLDNNRTDLLPPIIIQSDGERALNTTAYMANAYYHFHFNTLFTPYIGGGIGMADVSLEQDPLTPAPTGREDSVGAWQAMIGLAFEPHPDSLTEWNLGYRYFTTDDPEFDDGLGGTTVLENRIHTLELGVRLRF